MKSTVIPEVMETLIHLSPNDGSEFIVVCTTTRAGQALS
jgi:hypothetical protein